MLFNGGRVDLLEYTRPGFHFSEQFDVMILIIFFYKRVCPSWNELIFSAVLRTACNWIPCRFIKSMNINNKTPLSPDGQHLITTSVSISHHFYFGVSHLSFPNSSTTNIWANIPKKDWPLSSIYCCPEEFPKTEVESEFSIISIHPLN